jgi:MFS family permease
VRALLLPLLAIGVLGALLWFGDAPRVISFSERFQRVYLIWFLCSMVAHEAVRALLWLFLLRVLAIRAPIRTQIFAFAVAEAFKAVPAGAYVENYLLQRSQGSSFGRSSAATTFMILGEIISALVGVIVLGLGSWSQWLRLAIGILVVVVVIVVLTMVVVPRARRFSDWICTHRIVVRVLEEVRRFRSAAAILMRPPIIAISLLLCALYVLLDALNLYIVVRALGITGLSFGQVVAVACFGLAFYVILASLEAADVGALIGLGLSKSLAVSAILVYRALSICTTVLLAAVVMILFHNEWSALRRGDGIPSS